MGKLTALIDSDTPAFSAAISSQDKPLWVALSRLDEYIERIIEGSGADTYRLFVAGTEKTFRHEIDPMYKGNRTRPDPEHREECRLHLINRWDATEAIGCESDDLVGCNQTENTIICGIDKDLLTIPGKHYQWPIFRGGKEIRPARFHEITYIEGMRTFFEQMLIGDSSDNIVGVTGLGKVKAAKELENCPTEVQMYERVRYLYVDQDRFYKNLDLLWIWRNLGETYSIRNEIRGIV